MSVVKSFMISIKTQSFVLVEKFKLTKINLQNLQQQNQLSTKKEIDPDAIADGEDFVAKEDQAEEMVISLDDQKEIEETLEKEQEN